MLWRVSGAYCETNIDECASSPCSEFGTCQDGDGMYTCTCQEDFYGINHVFKTIDKPIMYLTYHVCKQVPTVMSLTDASALLA